jgi:hypothetical protein
LTVLTVRFCLLILVFVCDLSALATIKFEHEDRKNRDGSKNFKRR